MEHRTYDKCIEKLVDCFATPDVYETKDNAESESYSPRVARC